MTKEEHLMSASFILSCESTVDLPYSYIQERGIPVLFYTYLVDGKEYIDDMGRDPEALPTFYRLLQDNAPDGRRAAYRLWFRDDKFCGKCTASR